MKCVGTCDTLTSRATTENVVIVIIIIVLLVWNLNEFNRIKIITDRKH